MARWGKAYLHCKGHQRLEQTGGAFPAGPGHAGLQWQVGADSFQQLGQFLQLDTVPPSNPKLTACSNPYSPPRATLRKGGGQRKLNSKPLTGGGQQGSVSLLVFSTSCFHCSTHKKTSWKQMEEATWSTALHVLEGNIPVLGRVLVLGKWECPSLAEAEHPHAKRCHAASLAATAPRRCTAAHWLEARPGPPPHSPQPSLP